MTLRKGLSIRLTDSVYFAESLSKMFGKNHQLPPKEDDIL